MLAWNLVLFNFVIVPLLLLAFLRYPIRMSRAWVFVASCACSLYGLGLTVQQLVFIGDPELRPRYAVTWQPLIVEGETASLHECTCGCDYPVATSVCTNLCIIGVLTIIKSFFLGFRCLKGLRRSQWANLLSVLFPVPLTVYSVDWRQPTGQPIKYRTEGVPVQAEVAFDPFAMMDEQLDSHITTVHLRPEPVHRYQHTASGGWKVAPPLRAMETPSAPMPACFASQRVQERDTEYIGCCGFPWPTGGKQCVFEPELIEQFDQRDVPLRPRSEAEPDDASALSSGSCGEGLATASLVREDESGEETRRRVRDRTLESITVSVGELACEQKSSLTRASVSSLGSAAPSVIGVPHAGGVAGQILCPTPLPPRPPPDQEPPVFADDEGRPPKKRTRKASETRSSLWPQKGAKPEAERPVSE